MTVASKLMVILPTYNEKDNILVLIGQILSLKLEAELQVLVVDDDSTDLTWQVVEHHYASDSRVKVLRRKGKERGLVNSLKDAIAHADTEYVLWMDADLQMPATRIPSFLEILRKEAPTAVIGSRYLPGGKDLRHKGSLSDDEGVVELHRNFSFTLSRFIPVLLGIPATDVTSGFIAIRRDFFENYQLKGSHGEYFIDLVHELYRKQQKVIEIPYRLMARAHGVSKSTQGKYLPMFKTGLRYLLLVFRIYLGRK